uniref:Uncharacterized protein n=1 Tax=Panagrolaimus sp. ES5 TaxID=591445 RepID=A0AC34GAH3_9BILA
MIRVNYFWILCFFICLTLVELLPIYNFENIDNDYDETKGDQAFEEMMALCNRLSKNANKLHLRKNIVSQLCSYIH